LAFLDTEGLSTEDGTLIDRHSPMALVNNDEIVSAFYAAIERRQKPDGSPLHNNAQRQYGHACRALWSYCCDGKFWAPQSPPITWNACAPVPMVHHERSHRKPVRFSVLAAVYDAAKRIKDPRVSALAVAVLQILSQGGLRRRELIGLEVCDFNRDEKTLHVRHAKGGKLRYQKIDDVCCAAIDRYLSLRGEYIRGRWELRRGWHHVPDESQPDYLFTHSLKRHLGTTGITRLFERLERSAGFTKDSIRPHQIRRCQASRINIVAGLKAAQEYLDHDDLRTTIEYFDRATPEEMDDALRSVQIEQANDEHHSAAPPSTTPDPERRAQRPRKSHARRCNLPRRRIAIEKPND
jgi:integrase